MTGDVKQEQPAKEAPVARIVSPKVREQMVPLEFPVEFDGEMWAEIKVRRVTAGEVDAFMEALGEDRNVMPPMVDCPREVYDAMDDDDRYELDRVMLDFMPRRLKVAAVGLTPLTDGSASGQ